MRLSDGKSRRARMPGWPIDGKPVRRLVGMIYWYGWGDDRDFDIREVRKALGLPEESKHDNWFMSDAPRAGCTAFHAQMTQLQDALSGRDFATLLDEIDRATEERCRQEAQERLAAVRRPAPLPDPYEDFPF
jgi:hypothetical protein